MEGLNPFLIGFVLALSAASVGVMALLGTRARAQFVYGQLCVMTGIYVGFAVAGLGEAGYITRADWTALLIEAVIATGFLLGGLILLESARIWLLGVLMLGHGVIDLGHLLVDGALSPAWYAFVCVIYDAIVGAAAMIMLSPAKPPAEN